MPSRLVRWIVPTLIFTAALPTAAPAEASAPVVTRTCRQGRWHIAETKNFFVCSDQSAAHARRLAEGAEAQRTALRKLWLGTDADEAWSPQCHLVLHSTREAYVAAVGRGGQWTIGSS